jgi:hypothetical protein
MTLNQGLNLLGLLLITVGGVGAAMCTPSPQYNPNGSVAISGKPDQDRRIGTFRRQKWLPRLLACVGLGALLQAIALFVG